MKKYHAERIEHISINQKSLWEIYELCALTGAYTPRGKAVGRTRVEALVNFETEMGQSDLRGLARRVNQ